MINDDVVFKKLLLRRLFRYLRIPDDQTLCWEWTGFKDRDGYARVTYTPNKTIMIHRLSYELFVGPIPDGMFVCHWCDNPPCCNPEHLWLGTALENNLDARKKNRLRSRPLFSKLTQKQFHLIRELRGTVSASKLAILCGVSQATIYKIWHYKMPNEG